ncbi:MAG TPA: glycosyltransferase family 2 protein [Thermoanaerobaculia bacterium]|nr:glycosyltransferase family 2 protein [Thermoanaerobaculia bacterium]
MTIAAVIPTRNRGAVAVQAVQSLLDQDCEIEIFVSDNSAFPDDALRDFCASNGVHYVHRTPEVVTPTHWDQAIREAMERSNATHFTVHYDRKVSKPRHLGMVQAIASRWPEHVITWPHDYVADTPPPMRLWQAPWTGHVYALRTARLVQLTAAGRAGSITSHALPLLSNCLVPRSVLSEVVERFGDLCDSTTADSAFAYRFCSVRERYLHFDRSMGVLHSPHRSTGLGYMRGRGGDFDDFRRQWGDRPWLDAAPIPGINLGLNMLYHEYERVRRATGDQLPPIDRAAYVEDLAGGLPVVSDPSARAELRRVLMEEGWRGREPRMRGFLRHSVLAFLDERLGLRVPGVTGRVFRDDRDALRHALAHPRRRREDARHLAMLEPEQVETG